MYNCAKLNCKYGIKNSTDEDSRKDTAESEMIMMKGAKQDIRSMLVVLCTLRKRKSLHILTAKILHTVSVFGMKRISTNNIIVSVCVVLTFELFKVVDDEQSTNPILLLTSSGV